MGLHNLYQNKEELGLHSSFLYFWQVGVTFLIILYTQIRPKIASLILIYYYYCYFKGFFLFEMIRSKEWNLARERLYRRCGHLGIYWILLFCVVCRLSQKQKKNEKKCRDIRFRKRNNFCKGREITLGFWFKI